MRYPRLEHRFVQYLPERMEPGILYVSMEYGTVAHRCCCGCGEEVVTPLTPTDWKLIYDGETISLKPSVGNWNLACRSHYVIDHGRVIEAGPWSDERIAAELRRDKIAKERYYGPSKTTEEAVPAAAVPPPEVDRSLYARLGRWLSRLLHGRSTAHAHKRLSR
ncbi:hypothetical protein ASNO1_23760 [Corallococcus caeni]|uniref:PARP-type domain-containing protein n=1 Tax=Corallococcus caeni TaxID=3082388 RepID=A0ABQ6QQ28_9BACT|nr:hypothetical protein ASNO1_23760 [Corallococcus sp. NO1]